MGTGTRGGVGVGAYGSTSGGGGVGYARNCGSSVVGVGVGVAVCGNACGARQSVTGEGHSNQVGVQLAGGVKVRVARWGCVVGV